MVKQTVKRKMHHNWMIVNGPLKQVLRFAIQHCSVYSTSLKQRILWGKKDETTMHVYHKEMKDQISYRAFYQWVHQNDRVATRFTQTAL